MANDGDTIINVESISKTLNQKNREGIFSEKQFSIYRVPAHIRKNNESYYEPRMVSIGPYHRNNEHLRAMEDHKWRFLNEFVEKNNDILYRCTKEMTDLEAKARVCYFENVHLDKHQFVEMMLLDSCFIIQLLIKWRYNEKDALLHVGWASPLLKSDILMLENQIPFFVLTKMYEIYTDVHRYPPIAPNNNTPDNKWPPFIRLCEDTLRSRHVIHEIYKEDRKLKDPEVDAPKHLLDCFYRITLPNQTKPQKDEERPRISRHEIAEERSVTSVSNKLKYLFDIIYGFKGKQINTEHSTSTNHVPGPTNASISGYDPRGCCGSKQSCKKRRSPIFIPSAIELKKFGVTLKKKKKCTSFLDVSFKGGILEVPCFTIKESSRSRILNLIAFEQCNDVDIYPIKKPLSSYAAFMACLMNMSEDVIVVEKAGIIVENNLANSEEGAKFFHQLREFAHVDVDNHYLKQVFVEVNDYCHAFWPKHKATLRHDYFQSPWTIFSLAAALLLLSFTVFRTVCYILVYFTHDLKK